MPGYYGEMMGLEDMAPEAPATLDDPEMGFEIVSQRTLGDKWQDANPYNTHGDPDLDDYNQGGMPDQPNAMMNSMGTEQQDPSVMREALIGRMQSQNAANEEFQGR